MSETFKKLELTPLNVYKLMKECKKNEMTQNVIKSTFFSKTCGKKAPILEFDKEKILENKDSIRYMFGQLHAVHAKKATMIPSYGLLNYKEENWTDDNMALFSLYYLGTAASVFPEFEKGIHGGVASPIGEYKNLKPTFWPPEPEKNDDNVPGIE